MTKANQSHMNVLLISNVDNTESMFVPKVWLLPLFYWFMYFTLIYQKFIGTYLPLASVTEKSSEMMLCSHFKVDEFHHTVFDLGYLYLAQQQGTWQIQSICATANFIS